MAGGRTRVVKSKPTRNGCRTCRIRKVKCDEARPCCKRCTSTGRSCDGYEAGLLPRNSQQRALLPLTTGGRPLIKIVVNPSPILWKIDNFERLSYDNFRLELAPSLMLMLPTSSWIQTALQLSMQEEAVFSAVSALGSINKAIAILVHPSFGRPLYRSKLNQSIKQYCRAAATLRKRIEKAISNPGSADLASILLSCVICMCFEVFRGKQTLALSHSALGRRICEECIINNGRIDGICGEIYELLSMHADRPIPLGQQEYHDDTCCLDLELPVSTSFSSLAEAATYLGILVRKGDHLRSEILSLAEEKLAEMYLGDVSEGMRYCLAACFSRTVNTQSKPHFEISKNRLLQAHRRWEKFFTALPKPESEFDRNHFIAGQVVSLCFELNLSTCRQTYEKDSDAFEKDFEHIIGLLGHLLANPGDSLPVYVQEQARLAGGKEQNRSFSIFSTLCGSLYFFALKCRDRSLRRRAIQILFSAQRREGLEHSSALGYFAQGAMQIEEEQAREDVEIPEAARFCDIVMAGEGNLPIFKLICCRYVHGSAGEVEMLEYLGGSVPLTFCSSRRIMLPVS